MIRHLGYAALALGLSAQAQASEALAKEKNCMTCHSVERKIVGPSYRDILAKKPTEAAMAQKIKQGSKGECGDKGGFFLNGTSRSEIACYGSVYCFSG